MTQSSKKQVFHNEKLMQHFNKTIEKKQLAHAYLFNGPKGAGQKAISIWLSMRLFCKELVDDKPCEHCQNCLRIKNGEHPDVITVKSDKATIKVDQIRIIKQEFIKSPVEGNHKVLIIEHADKMTISAQNSLLKFIEEPLGDTVILLLTENRNLLLPTIISRTQVVDIDLPKLSYLEKELQNATLGEKRLALKLTSNIDSAQNLIDNKSISKLNNLMWRWFNVLLQKDLAAFSMIQTGFVPLLQETEDLTVEQIFDAIMFVFRDLLLIDEEEKIVFVDNEESIANFAKNIPQDIRLKCIELVLNSRSSEKMNINFQNMMEALTLQLLLTIQNKGTN